MAETRHEMILKHLPLVAFVVGRMSADRHNTMGLEREDAMAYGTEGLIQAVDAFDPQRGTSFASFAIRRIRGSILDAMRRQDPLPRSLRRSTRQVEQARQELASQLGRWPTPKELGLKLGLNATEMDNIRRHSASRFVSLEHVLRDGEHDEGTRVWDPADEDDFGDPARALDRRASLSMLRNALETLNEREREILQLRYGEARPFHEIGRQMGLSESRVCQLHKRIIGQLRRRLTVALDEAA
jgi:RNA polymerase sigma factor for flagellar operon FliA